MCYFYLKLVDFSSNKWGKEMGLIVAIDNKMLSFFTKISHKFYRLTGRTNFFLAKLAICIMTASVMTVIFSYWFPAILDFQPSLFAVVIAGLVSMLCLVDMASCDKAEKSAFSNNRVRMFCPPDYSPPLRVLWVFLTSIVFFMVPFNITNGKGYLIFKVLFFSFIPAVMAFKYLISVDPPSPGKSKIREWVEAFSAGFQKLAPTKVKS